MAQIDFILQGVTNANHSKAIQTMLALPEPTQVLLSVAFVREGGLDAVEAAIMPLAAKSKFFIGIRNDITSIQAIKRLLAMKVELYAVDTGSRNTIFHPKLYFATNGKHATVIIGSANLTFGGLHKNIEVSTITKLDLSNATDKKFADEVTTVFTDMLTKHPQHVFLIKNNKQADDLFDSGRLADENVIPAPSPISHVKKGERDYLPPMKLSRTIQRRRKIAVGKPSPKITKLVSLPLAAVPKYLIWESKQLTERDLNIPRSTSTNPTCSMGLKKGALDEIDQRHYFREDVFAQLTWTLDTPPLKWERAQVKVEVVIKNLNYGIFDLKLSHNTDKKSASYKQKNFMTQIHWGDAKKHVAKRDLLGRILYLYRKDTDPPEFMIEID